MIHCCHYARNKPEIYPSLYFTTTNTFYYYKNTFFMLAKWLNLCFGIKGYSKLHFEIYFYIKMVEKLNISTWENKHRKFIRLVANRVSNEGMIFRANGKTLISGGQKGDMTEPLKNKAGCKCEFHKICTKIGLIYKAWGRGVTNNRQRYNTQITHGEEQLVLVSTNSNETFGFRVEH